MGSSFQKQLSMFGWLVVIGLFLGLSACAPVKFKSNSDVGKKDCEGSSCTPVDPKYSYNWVTGSFGLCSKPCGGGEQARSVVCQRQDGVNVPDSFCKTTKPAATQTCNIQACTGSYAWNIGDYGQCSKACGGGTQNRTVLCQDQSGASAAENLCPQPKPGTSQACNTQACPEPVTYMWDVGTWGQCSKSCDGGTQTRTVVCRGSDGGVYADSFCTEPKPATQQACNTQACPIPYTYSWVIGNYGTCSKTCGGGTQTRTVVCKRDQDGAFVGDNLCPQPKPGTSQACNTQSCPVGKYVKQVEYVTPAQNQVDILLVFDDSGSMAQDNKKLASRMGGFVSDLEKSGIDYRMCTTTTDISYHNGRPIKWVGTNSHIFDKNTPNKQTVFNDTIAWIGSGWSNDEQGIKAMNLSIADNPNSGCYRPDAALAVILISDENERSVGGNYSWSSAQYKPLTTQNYPDTLINLVKSTFNRTGFTKKFVVNSIIVKPGDTTCEAQQDAQGSPSFFGTLYKELSDKTGGYVGSICDADYSSNLKYFKDAIFNTMDKIQLQCVPLGTPVVTISPNMATTITLQGSQLIFNPVLPQNTQVTVEYYCP